MKKHKIAAAAAVIAALAVIAAVLMSVDGNKIGKENGDDMKKIRIMPLGDSITDGFTTPGGYRNTLCALLEESGLSDRVEFCGSQCSGSGYDGRHEGHPGWATVVIDPARGDSGGEYRDGITEHLEAWLKAAKPDVVLLQIGTNDIISGHKLESLGERFEHIADTVLAALPEDGRLYAATIPYMDGTRHVFLPPDTDPEVLDKAVRDYNEKIRAAAEKRDRMYIAEINGVLDKSDLADGVHPSEAGYEKMGQFWYGIVRDLLK